MKKCSICAGTVKVKKSYKYNGKKYYICDSCSKRYKFDSRGFFYLRKKGSGNVSKLQRVVRIYLKRLYGSSDVFEEVLPCWMVDFGRRYRFDFYIVSKNVYVEVHGRQHFYQYPEFQSEEEFLRAVERDREKRELVGRIGGPYRLVYILFDDPIYDIEFYRQLIE